MRPGGEAVAVGGVPLLSGALGVGVGESDGDPAKLSDRGAHIVTTTRHPNVAVVPLAPPPARTKGDVTLTPALAFTKELPPPPPLPQPGEAHANPQAPAAPPKNPPPPAPPPFVLPQDNPPAAQPRPPFFTVPQLPLPDWLRPPTPGA